MKLSLRLQLFLKKYEDKLKNLDKFVLKIFIKERCSLEIALE